MKVASRVKWHSKDVVFNQVMLTKIGHLFSSIKIVAFLVKFAYPVYTCKVALILLVLIAESNEEAFDSFMELKQKIIICIHIIDSCRPSHL